MSENNYFKYKRFNIDNRTLLYLFIYLDKCILCFNERPVPELMMLSTGIFQSGPVPKTTQKYNIKGFSKPEFFTNMNVETRYVEMLAGATNLALTESSKSQYKTAVKHVVWMEECLDLKPKH